MSANRFRFRVWNSLNKAMYGHAETAENTSVGMLSSRDYPFAIVMQSTGFLDKNGKEIYEGDIVEYTLKTLPKETPCRNVVEFRDGMWCVMKQWDEKYGWGDTKEVLPIYNMKLMVVGNVYQNPELLK